MCSTFWRFDPTSMAQEVVAMRDIEEGEEISHSCKLPIRRERREIVP